MAEKSDGPANSPAAEEDTEGAGGDKKRARIAGSEGGSSATGIDETVAEDARGG
eukprot:CAMPEP_0182562458 /NCGR_PEP_ID=MMETSP1324-20130603/4800_1 /TAXON_ID=236786 /ORGANISM="Florenciella sp., Strain RCC1587" /LENGTH=53 /DNA_ID=CAMNT_0024775411 /DNA_START=32 /DNA_END=190 /DNA_ORIENTATION=+